MAARKKSRSNTASKRPKAKVVTKAKLVRKKTIVKAKAKAPARKAARAKADRKVPETLRLKAYAPSLTVNDLGKSISFYRDGLGFFVADEWKDGDVLRGVMLRAGVTELGLSQDDGKQGMDRKKGQGFRLYCYTAQDPDSVAERLKAAGYSLTDETADHPAWGVRSFSVDDPDGFHLTIAREL